MAKLGDADELYTKESLPFFFDEEKITNFSALRDYECLTIAQLAFWIPANLPSSSDSSFGEVYLHYINLVLLDVAQKRLDPKHPTTVIPHSEYLRMAKAGLFGDDGYDTPLPTADWLISLEDAGKWALTKGIILNFDELTADLSKSKFQEIAVTHKENNEAHNWKMRIQAQAAILWREYIAANCSPTKNNIKTDLAKWCRANGITTNRGIFPDEGYIYRHILRGWKPPMS